MLKHRLIFVKKSRDIIGTLLLRNRFSADFKEKQHRQNIDNGILKALQRLKRLI
jgi:hypothetical protein